MKQHFLYRLKAPRATFPQDMTPEEPGIMARHVEYSTGLLEVGVVVASGPVADPAGFWRVAIIKADSIDDALVLSVDDPAVNSGIGRRVPDAKSKRARTWGMTLQFHRRREP